MADMVWRPRFAEDDLDSEREIVLEEIAMYEDDPQDKVFDVLGEAVFGDHPLGRADHRPRARSSPARRPTGLRPSTPRATCRRNVVVAAAGSVDHDRARRARRADARAARAPPAPGCASTPPGRRRARVRFIAKETEQYHVCLGAPGIARDDERRFALRVLDNILGGTSSSRLFQEVRESRGLAYSVYSFTSHYAGTGQVGLYLGTRPDNVGRGAAASWARSSTALRADGVDRGGARALQGERQGPAWCWRSSRRPRA